MNNKTEIFHKELDLIQGVISRMANNSFLVKGWFIGIFCILIALSKDALVSANSSLTLFLFALPLIAFWWLDAFFLHKEKCYRTLYNWVIQNRVEGNMDKLYDLDYKRFIKEEKSISQLLFSATLIIFYGLPYLILLGLIVFLST